MESFKNISPYVAEKWLAIPKDWRRPEVQQKFEIWWDRQRSYGQIWPRPSLEEVTAFYDVADYYTHQADGILNPKSGGIEQKVLENLSWRADQGKDPDKNWWSGLLGAQRLRILEVGCGSGSNLAIFDALGHEAVGVEPDKEALAVARDRGYLVYDGTAETLPLEVSKEVYDVVVFMHVLEHCIDPFVAVKAANNVLKPGGLLIAEVPNNECLGATTFGELWHWLDVPRHLNFFTAKSLIAVISAAGLQVQSIDFRGYNRQFSASWKAVQARIADIFQIREDGRISRRGYWKYLPNTAWAEDRKKYDSVRIVGIKSKLD